MKLIDIFNLPLYWEMTSGEKLVLYSVLLDLKPLTSIEIGTKGGGSL